MHLRYVRNDLNQHFILNFSNRSLAMFLLSSEEKKKHPTTNKFLFGILIYVLK